MLNNLLAAFVLLTRLPFWRIREVPARSFRHIIGYWPLVGWLTGGVMAGVLWIGAQVLPVGVAWLLAIVARLLLTGCIHEDGLADFIDGFGGGSTRERTLAIMKDSHIGSYGVVGLIVYFLLLTRLAQLPLSLLCMAVLSGDCLGKMCASHATIHLPYARRREDSKLGSIYAPMTGPETLLNLRCGLLPTALLCPVYLWPAVALPLGVAALLYGLMRRRLQGYTGDCCGAAFLLCELSFYLGVLALYLVHNAEVYELFH